MRCLYVTPSYALAVSALKVAFRCPHTLCFALAQCPFAHPGEKARRRDTRKFRYSGTACPEYRKVRDDYQQELGLEFDRMLPLPASGQWVAMAYAKFYCILLPVDVGCFVSLVLDGRDLCAVPYTSK